MLLDFFPQKLHSVTVPKNYDKGKIKSLKRNGLILEIATFNHSCTIKNFVLASQMLMAMDSLINVHQMMSSVTSIVEQKVPQSCVTMELLKQHCPVSLPGAERTSGFVLRLISNIVSVNADIKKYNKEQIKHINKYF